MTISMRAATKEVAAEPVGSTILELNDLSVSYRINGTMTPVVRSASSMR